VTPLRTSSQRRDTVPGAWCADHGAGDGPRPGGWNCGRPPGETRGSGSRQLTMT